MAGGLFALLTKDRLRHEPLLGQAVSSTHELRPEALLSLEQYMAAVVAACPPMPQPDQFDDAAGDWDPTVADDLRPTMPMPRRADCMFPRAGAAQATADPRAKVLQLV